MSGYDQVNAPVPPDTPHFDDGASDRSWGFWALVDLDASDRDCAVSLDVITVGER